jgi:hypothetical protein
MAAAWGVVGSGERGQSWYSVQPCFVNSAPALAALCSLCLFSLAAPAAPARQAPQLAVSSFQLCSGDQAQTCESRAASVHPSRNKCSLVFGPWSLEPSCAKRNRTQTRRTGQWACIPAAWEPSTQAKGQRAHSILELGRLLASATRPTNGPLPPPFSIFGSSGHGVSLLPCNLAPTMTWSFWHCLKR